jgi:chromosome condensin MukBEF MukE localization factor
LIENRRKYYYLEPLSHFHIYTRDVFVDHLHMMTPKNLLCFLYLVKSSAQLLVFDEIVAGAAEAEAVMLFELAL